MMKYKVRKAEALSKLESSKQNLQRVNDIVFEENRTGPGLGSAGLRGCRRAAGTEAGPGCSRSPRR